MDSWLIVASEVGPAADGYGVRMLHWRNELFIFLNQWRAQRWSWHSPHLQQQTKRPSQRKREVKKSAIKKQYPAFTGKVLFQNKGCEGRPKMKVLHLLADSLLYRWPVCLKHKPRAQLTLKHIHLAYMLKLINIAHVLVLNGKKNPLHCTILQMQLFVHLQLVQ